MSADSPPVCFSCGGPAGDPPVLNRRPDGGPCSACADRLLESLAPALPAPRGLDPAEADELRLLTAARDPDFESEDTPA